MTVQKVVPSHDGYARLCQNMLVLSDLAKSLKVSTFIVYCTNKYASWYLNHRLFVLSGIEKGFLQALGIFKGPVWNISQNLLP